MLRGRVAGVPDVVSRLTMFRPDRRRRDPNGNFRMRFLTKYGSHKEGRTVAQPRSRSGRSSARGTDIPASRVSRALTIPAGPEILWPRRSRGVFTARAEGA